MSIEPESNGNNQGDAIYFLSVPIGQVDVPFCLVGGYDAAFIYCPYRRTERGSDYSEQFYQFRLIHPDKCAGNVRHMKRAGFVQCNDESFQ